MFYAKLACRSCLSVISGHCTMSRQRNRTKCSEKRAKERERKRRRRRRSKKMFSSLLEQRELSLLSSRHFEQHPSGFVSSPTCPEMALDGRGNFSANKEMGASYVCKTPLLFETRKDRWWIFTRGIQIEKNKMEKELLSEVKVPCMRAWLALKISIFLHHFLLFFVRKI